MLWSFHCTVCDATFSASRAIHKCAACGGLLEVAVQTPRDPRPMESARSTLRYGHCLPIDVSSVGLALDEGMTPLVRARLAGRSVLIKLDSMCPSGSFKDRGTILLVAHALMVSATEIVIDSSGNAASSVAMYAARAGLPCRVFVPANASAGKLVQAKAMGAQVIAVAGDRGAAGDAAEEACSATSYYANHNWSPLFPEGVMTWYLEVLEQLSSPPSQVFVPTSGGSVVAATGIAMSIAGTTTAVHAVQPAVCAPLLADYLGQPAPSPQISVAEGANIADPPRRTSVLKIVRNSGGSVRGVSEQQITDAARELWSQGIYVEPTGALGAAGFIAAVQDGVEVAEDSVVLVTGHGLKTTPTNDALIEARQ